MKQFYLAFIFSLFSLFAYSQNFYLAPNGVTCMCPDAAIGETGFVNGITYTKRTKEQITPANAATTCTSGITDMSELFINEASFNGNISTWDVSSVTTMWYMFFSATSFNQPLNNWDVSNVTNMGAMFYNANSFNRPLNNWDVSNVTNMWRLFSNAWSFNQPLTNWDVSNVTDMGQMFVFAISFNQSLSNWDVSNVTNMRLMFRRADLFNQPLNNWDVSSVIDMSAMFNPTILFNQPLDNWDVSNVTTMSSMFNGASSFNQPLDIWDVSNVTNMIGIFNNASSFNQPLNDWNVSNVTDMSSMFSYADEFNMPLDNWDVSNVTDMGGMFENAVLFNQPLNNWDVSNVINMGGMFLIALSFDQPLNDWNVSNVTNMGSMFRGTDSFNQPLDNWNVSNVTDMGLMFYATDVFNQSLTSWDVSSVTDMSYMFFSADLFNQSLNNWNVSNVTDMRSMFREALLFNQPLNNWDVSNVTDMSNMFNDASSFNQDLSNWQINTGMLVEFLSNSGMDLSNYDAFLTQLATTGVNNGTLGADGLEYCNIAVRNYLIDTLGWTINGDNLDVNGCSFNTLLGNIVYDMNNDGCDTDDIQSINILINANDGTNNYATISQSNGEYTLYLLEDTYTISLLNLPSYFTATPVTSPVTFVGFDNVEELDFCLTANQVVNDLNITLLAIDEGRPGFEADYQLVVRNVGTETINNVSATLNFDNVMQSFVSALPIPSSTTGSSLSFELGTVQPFETRYMDITMQTFPPPTVNGDDILQFTATVTPDAGDYTPDDNTYEMEQVVVNSFDPNDKQVMQGAEVHIDDVDQYLDYLIRFQNSGTASAINVRILDTLHPKLDWNTLIPISASHDYVVQITDGNQVEFIFDDINLPHESANEPESHGFVAYKIKPKTDVQVGDILSGDAAIYFDFNAPIITNMVFTEIVDNLNITDINEPTNLIVVYPNPTSKTLHLQVTGGIQIKESTIYNLQGKDVQKIPGNETVIDVEKLSPGMYFLKITTNKETITLRFVKR